MKKIEVSVIYQSINGHTEIIAKAIQQGATEINGSKTNLIKIDNEGKISEIDWQTLKRSQAIIFGAPTYMGSLPGAFKSFIDSTSKIWSAQKWKDKIAGGFTNSGGLSGDKLSSLLQLVIFAEQHGMIWVGNDIITQESKSLGSLNRLTSFVGIMSQSDQGSPEVTPPLGDINTAKLYGQRVAKITLKFAF